MQQLKCPNCGSSIFSSAEGDDDQISVTISCEYCGSEFETDNPNYRPPAASVNIYHTEVGYGYRRYYGYRHVPGWKEAPDWQHKVANVGGYILGGVATFFAIIMWVTAFMPGTDMPVGVPVIFSVFVAGIFLLAWASGRELKLRHPERSQPQGNNHGYTAPVKKPRPTPSQRNVGIPMPPPGSVVKVTPKWLLTVGMVFGYLGVAGTSCSVIAGLVNKNNELIHKVFGVAFLVVIFMIPFFILGRRCQIALQQRIAEEKAAAERWEEQSKQNRAEKL
ncbi:MAG: hypothetical protein JO154_23270 [Chitinophaga sp.]|uniref:hypothetical protein n=1 Tax=Chitinophaga sp. TaxID=1869181 RepID=UPI0025BF7DCE|nr:hypothetical protein [Chitinophaga sp.]MBV8255537.1 hypothetical protein [Chitinophaga sp.]